MKKVPGGDLSLKRELAGLRTVKRHPNCVSLVDFWRDPVQGKRFVLFFIMSILIKRMHFICLIVEQLCCIGLYAVRNSGRSSFEGWRASFATGASSIIVFRIDWGPESYA